MPQLREHIGLQLRPTAREQHYWRAGSSSKNTDEARRAGVVGTFGIGAMANFGIADRLEVETESLTGERTYSEATKANLSTTEDTILLDPRPTTGEPGTTVTADVDVGIDVNEAITYIADLVAFVDIPVYINGDLASKRDISSAVPSPAGADHFRRPLLAVSENVSADVTFAVAPGTGDVWAQLINVKYAGDPIEGSIVLRQGGGSIRTFRSGFGLATVSASSA